jgi:hypothetical protein
VTELREVQVGSTVFNNAMASPIKQSVVNAPRDASSSSWREQKLKDVISQYSPNDVYSAN